MTLTDEEVKAIIEVQGLMARYVQSVDAGDPDAIASLFTPDARMEGFKTVPVIDGREQIHKFFADRERSLDRSTMAERHHITTLNVRFDDDGVLRATSYLQVLGLPSLFSAVYEDEFEKHDDRWLFKRKHVTVEIS